MRERSHRLVLFLAAVALAAPLYFKGHGTSRRDGAVAFLPFTAAGVTVRLTGAIEHQGIYAFGDDATISTVKNMTMSSRTVGLSDRPADSTPLENGTVIHITLDEAKLPVITVKSMKARDKMLLGIPLTPDSMESDDWGCLPGIGAALARRLYEDRQINGDYLSIDAVRRVPGIGEKKFQAMLKYF